MQPAKQLLASFSKMSLVTRSDGKSSCLPGGTRRFGKSDILGNFLTILVFLQVCVFFPRLLGEKNVVQVPKILGVRILAQTQLRYHRENITNFSVFSL